MAARTSALSGSCRSLGAGLCSLSRRLNRDRSSSACLVALFIWVSCPLSVVRCQLSVVSWLLLLLRRGFDVRGVMLGRVGGGFFGGALAVGLGGFFGDFLQEVLQRQFFLEILVDVELEARGDAEGHALGEH